MSQSETWDALRLAAEWRSIGRDEEAARVMPEAEVELKRRTASASAKSITPPIIKSSVTRHQVQGITLVHRAWRWMEWKQEMRINLQPMRYNDDNGDGIAVRARYWVSGARPGWNSVFTVG